MKLFKKVGIVAGVSIAALAISGCYAFSGLTSSKSALKPGKSSTINVKSFSASGANDRDVFFLLIGLPDNGSPGDTSDDPLVAKKGRFDTTGVLYRRPKPLRANAELRDFIVSEGNCGNFDLGDAPTSRFVVLASERRVKQTAPRKQVNSRYLLKQIRLNEFLNPLAMVTVVGAWDDDGDGVPEDPPGLSPSEVQCGGGANHNINAKVPASERASATVRELERAYGG